jgi:hypothetical protein
LSRREVSEIRPNKRDVRSSPFEPLAGSDIRKSMSYLKSEEATHPADDGVSDHVWSTEEIAYLVGYPAFVARRHSLDRLRQRDNYHRRAAAAGAVARAA